VARGNGVKIIVILWESYEGPVARTRDSGRRECDETEREREGGGKDMSAEREWGYERRARIGENRELAI
jgi:hypothetical protein